MQVTFASLGNRSIGSMKSGFQIRLSWRPLKLEDSACLSQHLAPNSASLTFIKIYTFAYDQSKVEFEQSTSGLKVLV